MPEIDYKPVVECNTCCPLNTQYPLIITLMIFIHPGWQINIGEIAGRVKYILAANHFPCLPHSKIKPTIS